MKLCGKVSDEEKRKVVDLLGSEGCSVIEIWKKVYSYGTTQIRIIYECQEGHRNKTGLNNWMQGKRCPICNGNKVTRDIVEESFLSKSYEVLKIIKTKGGLKVYYKCPKGHRHSVVWSKWNKGRLCPYCRKTRFLFEDVVKEFFNEGYKIISDKNMFKETKYIEALCPEEHFYKVKLSNWRKGTRCPLCKSSKPEKDIQKFLTFNNYSYVCNDRKTIKNPYTSYFLELDIYIPNLMKAIEFNGKYWHSFPERQEKDLLKKHLCKEKNINLLIINEDDWLEDKNKCLNIIGEFLKI